jgi:hypothetical protein
MIKMTDAELKVAIHEILTDLDYEEYCKFLETLHTCPTREETEFYKGMDLDKYEF